MDKTNVTARVYKVGRVSPIETDKFNAFNEHVATDLARISEIVNKIADIINSAGALPDESISIENNALDGANIFVKKDAEDISFYYDPSLPDGKGGIGRPVTIKEAMDALYSVVSLGTRQVREGVRIGSHDAPVSIDAGGTLNVPWGYSDAMFVPYLYTAPPTVGIAESLTITLDTSSNTLSIHNDSGSSQDIWGVIWHPSFAF